MATEQTDKLERQHEHVVYQVARGMGSMIYEYFYGLEVYGLQNVPDKGGFLLACNHASYFDPPLAGFRIRRPIYYFARRTLMEKGFSKWLLTNLNTIPVDRDGPSDVAALKRVIRTVKGGNGLIVFPEGTRSHDGNLQPARAGVGLLACKTGAPVVPCRIFGAFDVYNRNTKLPRLRRKLTVVYGPPLELADYDPGGKGKERYQISADRIMAAIASIEKPRG